MRRDDGSTATRENSIHGPLGDPIGTGRVRSGDNYAESDEYFTWVTMTRDGETVTEQWPTRRVVLAR